jgi:SH3-like domain-containing protein
MPFGFPLRSLVMCCGLVSATVLAAEFHATTDVAVMYDAPSLRARPLFALGRDYPVETIVNLEGWSKVRDATGTVAWVEKKLIGDKRFVVVRAPTTDVLAAPEAGAPTVFKAEQNVLLELADTAYKSSTPGWAKVRHRDGQTGFVRIQQVWGL